MYTKAEQKQIAIRAYSKWKAAGSPVSDGKEFWLAAERELTHAEVTLEEVIDEIEIQIEP